MQSDAGEEELETEFVSVREPRSDDSVTDRLRFLMALCLVALGAVSNVMEAVALGNVQLSLRTTVSRVLSSWSAIATGMSIGREGPLIEFGGSLGAATGACHGDVPRFGRECWWRQARPPDSPLLND